MERLDVIIFGATGYTGAFAVEDLVKSTDLENGDLKFGIAGRSKSKLETVLKQVGQRTNKSLDHVPIIEADVGNEPSILAMCKQAKVIVNTVGPYQLYGEVVVRCCIQAKTHHVDLAGEPQFLEGIQLKYHKQAVESGVLIIGACGFDSIPVDCGINYMRDNFDGELAWVESYILGKSSKEHGLAINHGTWDSAITALANYGQVSVIRKELYNSFYTKRFPSYKYKLSRKVIPHVPEKVGKLSIPFWDTDKQVSSRTQLYNYIEKDERPVQVFNYAAIDSWLAVFAMIIPGIFILLFSLFRPTRKLLHDYPEIFTFGFVRKSGPTRIQVENSSFEMRLLGYGWPEKLSSPTDEPKEPPKLLVVAKVKGPEAGYVATSSFINQSAITILKDRSLIPFVGGVLTPGLAFRSTNLIKRLKNYSITFEIAQ